MHLVVESGSTKTEWRIVGEPNFSAQTEGLNPMIVSSQFLQNEIVKVAADTDWANSINQISFYGAGCSSSEYITILKNILSGYFLNANISVESNLVAAAKATFQNSKGISCILGTGTNAAYYDGNNLVQKIPSLGYILGDDGGGVGIGRAILKSYLYHQEDWSSLIQDLNLLQNREQIIQEIYNSENPNTFIASYAKLAMNNLDHPKIAQLVEAQFNLFFDDMVMPYKDQSNTIGFVGSVAFYGQEILKSICAQRNFEFKAVVKHPIKNLLVQLESNN